MPPPVPRWPLPSCELAVLLEMVLLMMVRLPRAPEAMPPPGPCVAVLPSTVTPFSVSVPPPFEVAVDDAAAAEGAADVAAGDPQVGDAGREAGCRPWD